MNDGMFFSSNLDLLTIGSQNQQKIYLAYNRCSRQYNSLIRNQITDQIPLQRTIKKVIGKKPIMEVKTDHSKKKVLKKKKREQDEDFNCQESQKISGKIGVKKKVFKSKSKVNQDDKMIQEQEINFQEIFTLNDEDLIYWALNAKLLKKPSFCKICRNTTGKKVIMKLIANKNYLDKFIWRCNNKDCGAIENIRNRNNLFGEFPRVKLRILLIFIFTHFTVMLSPSLSQQILKLNLSLIRRLSNRLSEIIIRRQIEEENQKGLLGGKDKVVEMDESCFFKRKNNAGRIQKQIWGFGLVERITGRLFVQIIPNRTAKTLIAIILKWVSKETRLLLSDEWKAYRSLEDLGFNHKTIKHKDNFVDPNNSEIHTQNIENRWGIIKGLMKKRGKISRISFDEKIKEIIWRISYKKNLQKELLKSLIDDIHS